MRPCATLSDCGRYRYTLSRRVDLAGLGWVLFLMLNPSVADATTDDPTMRRCRGFAQAWGFAGFEIGNLFALRSTDPKALYSAADPVGPENDLWLVRLVERADLVVCAWGAHGALQHRNDAVLELVRQLGAQPHYLRLTKHGHPEHPLRLPKTLTPQLLETAHAPSHFSQPQTP